MLSSQPLRILVVDDTVIYRKIVSDILASMPGIEVVGTAANGKIALQKIEQLRPDLITLDVEMPEVDGLEVLRRLKAANNTVGVLILSAFTTEGADITIAALSLGAFDFVVKPAGRDINESAESLKHDLQQKIEAFARAHHIHTILTGTPAAPPVRRIPPPPPPARPDVGRNGDVASRMSRLAQSYSGKPDVIAIGISTGGPQALTRMLPQLPASLPVPVLIVQHMPPKFTLSLANDLNHRCKLAVSEATDGQPVQAGRILIAPGGKQMKIDKSDGGLVVRITDDPAENHCKPSVDFLFRSVAHVCGPNALGIIMTGMGSDGALGCRLLKRRGAAIMTQDEATCVVYGMPKPPTEEGLADVVAPLDRIAPEIVRLVERSPALCS